MRGKEGDDTLSGARIEVDLDSGLGTLYDGRLFFKKDNHHVEGREIEKTAEREFTIAEGSFTTCDAELPAWRIRAREFEIVEDDYVAARSAWFHVRTFRSYTPLISGRRSTRSGGRDSCSPAWGTARRKGP